MSNVCNSVTETKNLSPNTWYKVTKNVSVIYNSSSSETAILYAISYDGINYSGISTGTVHKIDTTNPVLEINDVTITPSSLKVNYNLSDSESGIGLITCQYKLENSEYQSVAMDHVTLNSCNITGLSQSTNYIYNICVTDKVENGPICKSDNAITSNQTNSNLMINNKIASNLMSDGGFDSSDIFYFYNDNNYNWDNGAIKMVANSQQKFLRKNSEQFSGLTNHVLYARVSTKKTDASLHPGLYVITAAEFSTWHDQDSYCANFEEDDKTNTWKNVSCIFTSKYDKLTNIMIAQSNEEGTGVMYFDNFLILDLTEIFGSGNEPTRDWCDQNIQFPQ